MNSWLKVALYSFIGAVIGSFLLGIISTGSGMGYNGVPNYGQGMPYMNSYNSMQYGSTDNQMPMQNGMMHGGMMSNGMMGNGMGMGMMRR